MNNMNLTQLSILRAAKRVQVSFAVHHHAELSTTGYLHQGLPVVGDLERSTVFVFMRALFVLKVRILHQKLLELLDCLDRDP